MRPSDDIELPPDLELHYQEEIEAFEEEISVSYITTAERIGLQRGMQQGMQQGMQLGQSSLLVRQLERKFRNLPESYRVKVEQANADSLLKWGERLLETQTLEEVFSD